MHVGVDMYTCERLGWWERAWHMVWAVEVVGEASGSKDQTVRTVNLIPVQTHRLDIHQLDHTSGMPVQ